MRSVRMWSRGRFNHRRPYVVLWFNQEALSHARTVKGDKRGSAGARIYREQDCLPRCWASGNWQSLPLGAVWKSKGVCMTCQEQCRAWFGVWCRTWTSTCQVAMRLVSIWILVKTATLQNGHKTFCYQNGHNQNGHTAFGQNGHRGRITTKTAT